MTADVKSGQSIAEFRISHETARAGVGMLLAMRLAIAANLRGDGEEASQQVGAIDDWLAKIAAQLGYRLVQERS